MHPVEGCYYLIVLELLHEGLGALGSYVEVALQHWQCDGVARLDIIDRRAIQRVEVFKAALVFIVLFSLELWWFLWLEFLKWCLVGGYIGYAVNYLEQRHAVGACDGVVELEKLILTLIGDVATLGAFNSHNSLFKVSSRRN